MRDLHLEFLRTFGVAGQINHYYHNHTNPPDFEYVRVRHLLEAIQMVSGVPIELERVLFESTTLRGRIERYPERAVVKVRGGQSVEWERFTIIKEAVHTAIDAENAFEPDPLVTLSELTTSEGALLPAELSGATFSEHIAENVAVELLYPFELRGDDKGLLERGASVSEIAADRRVPAVYIEAALNDRNMEVCETFWSYVASQEMPRALMPAVEA